MKKILLFILFFAGLSACVTEQKEIMETVQLTNTFITVAADGSGDFSSVQQAIDSVVPAENVRTCIIIKNGVYEEKLFIEKDHIVFFGEDPEKTIIRYAELRENWIKKSGGDDWGAAVVNIRASDLAFFNLTLQNDYGDLHGVNDHQFTMRLFTGTRVITENCRIIAAGADTLSLWNAEDGMYYHNNCYFEGYTDFVCPRGTCCIDNSTFNNKKTSATLWHDGSTNENHKLVVKNSRFEGINGFQMGRRHYDAQFYIVDCSIAANVSRRGIYRVTYADTSRNRPNLWGDRYHFQNTAYDGKVRPGWMEDNLKDAKGKPGAEEITALWTFGGKWDPVREIKDIRAAAGR